MQQSVTLKSITHHPLSACSVTVTAAHYTNAAASLWTDSRSYNAFDKAQNHGRSPTYLSETVQVVGASRSRPGLRSSSTSQMDYALPRLHTKFSEHAFSYAGPVTWNALPDHIHTVADPVNFRRLLKTHYFTIAFSVC